VSLSFYKMFGYPTGIGALIARRDALEQLRRPWFAGGTITFSSVCAAADAGDGFYLSPGVTRFEDGTVNYLSAPAVDIGLRSQSSGRRGPHCDRSAAGCSRSAARTCQW
jgi:selenocysteine lyase/cysteine desulfurase